MACSHKDTCPLFKQFKLSSSLNFWKVQYCENERNFSSCERFRRSEKGEPVPATLLPSGDDLREMKKG